ncbi:unnamed protein product, partial [Musa acuminata var. zebrina]
LVLITSFLVLEISRYLPIGCPILSASQELGPSAAGISTIKPLVDLDASCCFICDLKHESIESCMVHMQKKHGFFIPDVEYLKDPKGLLMRVGLKVNVFFVSKRDFTCLYCNDRRPSFPKFGGCEEESI